jgi:hypothetical protein
LIKNDVMIPADPKAIVIRNTTFVAPVKASRSAIPRAARIFSVIPSTVANASVFPDMIAVKRACRDD